MFKEQMQYNHLERKHVSEWRNMLLLEMRGEHEDTRTCREQELKNQEKVSKTMGRRG